jgi:hypothetical protein
MLASMLPCSMADLIAIRSSREDRSVLAKNIIYKILWC